jgi:metal iron transporter
MPHSLYLGSGIVQPRLRSYDERHGLLPENLQSGADEAGHDGKDYYIPSLRAIRHCYRVSTLELSFALFTFALFVNSSIVIVSGVSLYQNPEAPEADIFSIHKLLSTSISSAAGTIFALSLLLSGVSAGIVCTISGQMVSEGALRWRVRPWLRRLITRSISIIPSVIIAAAVGRVGLSDALNASQVVLSVVLPFVSAPLIYFTCRAKYMMVRTSTGRGGEPERINVNDEHVPHEEASLANSWYTTAFAVLLWLIISVLNVANLVLLGLGN